MKGRGSYPNKKPQQYPVLEAGEEKNDSKFTEPELACGKHIQSLQFTYEGNLMEVALKRLVSP